MQRCSLTHIILFILVKISRQDVYFSLIQRNSSYFRLFSLSRAKSTFIFSSLKHNILLIALNDLCQIFLRIAVHSKEIFVFYRVFNLKNVSFLNFFTRSFFSWISSSVFPRSACTQTTHKHYRTNILSLRTCWHSSCKYINTGIIPTYTYLPILMKQK